MFLEFYLAQAAFGFVSVLLIMMKIVGYIFTNTNKYRTRIRRYYEMTVDSQE